MPTTESGKLIRDDNNLYFVGPWDASNNMGLIWRGANVSGNYADGRVVLYDANGGALVFDNDKARVSLYGKSSAAGDTAIDASTAGADGVSNTANSLRTSDRQHLFNGTTWDRARNNSEVTLLASAARTSTTVTSVQTNYNACGALFYLNVTANPGGGETVQFQLYALDPLSGNVSQLGAITAFTASNSCHGILIYPGATLAPLFGGIMSSALPRSYYAFLAHSGSGSWTYSLTMSYIL